MPTAVPFTFQRNTPRVILRRPLDAVFDGFPVLVVELGPGGAKLEHSRKTDIGRRARFLLGASLELVSEVRHSLLMPARDGVVFHTGISFTTVTSVQREKLMQLLIEEAQEQVTEWEANLTGSVTWRPEPARRSEVAHRFLCLQLTNGGWNRFATSDPNQPLDGVTIAGDTAEQDIAVLCETFEQGDHGTRELLRRIATVTILEGLRRG